MLNNDKVYAEGIIHTEYPILRHHAPPNQRSEYCHHFTILAGGEGAKLCIYIMGGYVNSELFLRREPSLFRGELSSLERKFHCHLDESLTMARLDIRQNLSTSRNITIILRGIAFGIEHIPLSVNIKRTTSSIL